MESHRKRQEDNGIEAPALKGASEMLIKCIADGLQDFLIAKCCLASLTLAEACPTDVVQAGTEREVIKTP